MRKEKEKMITRTITESEIVYMSVDVETTEVTIGRWKIGGEYTVETALQKTKKFLETDTLKIVAIQSITPTQKVIGMSIDDFILHGTVLEEK